MNGRLLLAMFIAVVPISVEMGTTPDTTHREPDTRPHEPETRVAVVANAGQFAIVRRGCNGEVLDVARSKLQSGALEVQHISANDVVIGARGGVVSERRGRFEHETMIPAAASAWRDNAYFNPYVGVDNRRVSFAVGFLHADHAFPMGEAPPLTPEVTGHVILRQPQGWTGLRFMEDLPLESEGYLTFECGVLIRERADAAIFVGMIGPFDGALVGLKGRIWLTREAALALRGGVSGDGEYTVGAGLEGRYGRH